MCAQNFENLLRAFRELSKFIELKKVKTQAVWYKTKFKRVFKNISEPERS